MVTIYNFENYCEPVVVARGKRYYYDGKVIEFELYDGDYLALVRGSEDYAVSAILGKTGALIEADCACNYKNGICHHLVAFYLTIREYLNNQINDNN